MHGTESLSVLFLLVFYIIKIWSGHKYSTLLFLWCVCLIALKLKQFSPLMVFSIMLAGVGMVEAFFMQICSRSQKHTLLVHLFINIPCWNISTLLIGTYIQTFLVGTYFDIPYWNIYSNIPWWDIFQHSILEHVFKHSLMGHISTLLDGNYRSLTFTLLNRSCASDAICCKIALNWLKFQKAKVPLRHPKKWWPPISIKMGQKKAKIPNFHLK